MKSNYLSINLADLIKGSIVAGVTVILSLIGSMIESGAFITDAQLIMAAKTGLLAAISYLVKNVFTNSKGKMFKSESN
jgi:hypothetical protein